MLESMFPRVKLERKTAPKKFVAASGGLRMEDNSIQDTRRGPQMHNIQERQRGFKTSHFSAECRPSWKHCCAGCKESAHSKYSMRNDDQDGREQRMCTMDMWSCLDDTGPASSRVGTVSGQTE